MAVDGASLMNPTIKLVVVIILLVVFQSYQGGFRVQRTIDFSER